MHFYRKQELCTAAKHTATDPKDQRNLRCNGNIPDARNTVHACNNPRIMSTYVVLKYGW